MLPTVICIDDEAHNNEAIERLLRKKYQIITTTDPQEGLNLIKKHQPVLIISDQRMPQITGVDLLKKSIATSPDSIRILLTGYTDLESVIAAINEGQIYRYLTKPWEPNDLQVTIDKAYETYLLRQELRKQNEQLKSLDKLKTDFMILVSHELRTPLTGISSFVQMLKEEIKNADQKVYLNHIDKNTERLKKLIEDILFITKIKTNAVSGEKQKIIIQDSLQKIWKTTVDKNNKLNLKIKTDLEEVFSSESLWQELWKRLFLNCSQHAPNDSEVTIEVCESKSSIEYEITNTMSKPLLVEPQSLISAFTKNEKIMNHTQGTGLGLSIVNAIAQAMSGELHISAKDKKFKLKIQIPKTSD
ncbi:hybrid sensor histidine kinase/response regulator [bacterium]|nr:hybrid sensor histidine kinase/response regulator [bacterium]